MANAKNKVIAGDYQGNTIKISPSCICVGVYELSKRTVDSYDLITEDKVKSGSSAILRGMAGVALLGGVGILAGLSAKNKGIYTIAIQWKDGKKSLIEIDDKLYKKFVADMF